MTATAKILKHNPELGHHSVRFYRNNAARIQGIAHYLAEGVDREEGVLLICSQDNRDLVFHAIGHIFTSDDWNQIHYIDSRWAMEKVFVNGAICSEVFKTQIYSRVQSLIRQFGAVRVYGDIVDDLAAAGNDDAVIDLEEEWHRALEQCSFRLHCGYMMEHFSSFKSTALFEKICRLHSYVENEDIAQTITSDAKHLADEIQIQKAKHKQQEAAIQNEFVEKDRLVALGELSAMVSHELNNPLTMIMFAASGIREWMKKQDLEGPQTAEFDSLMRTLERASQRMVSINRDVLSFSRGSSEQPIKFNLKDSIEHCIEHLALRVGSSEIELRTELPKDDNLMIFGSCVGIEQVILNLASNAIDSINEKRAKNPLVHIVGRVSIEVSRKDVATVKILVRDNGTGFSKLKQIKIFEPFFTTKPAGAGTGLGLTFCQKTLRLHGGSIDCESTEGEGTAFTILLPLRDV